ncbi:unnamed protein product [Cylindrotheca closterium]|uniref:PDZ domain-containing protein n=1 Tax=Cylindrotheca closterium TaxID=2856 RepID=A0AAD2CIR7_9STRA|nr:unnamed protein product [Cylindrotheca closterium]
MKYRQRLVGGNLRFVEEEEQIAGQYRQRLIRGKLRFVPPVLQEENPPEPSDRPFDESEEKVPTPNDDNDDNDVKNKNSGRDEVEHFDDLFKGDEACYEISSIGSFEALISGDKSLDRNDQSVRDEKHDSQHNHHHRHRHALDEKDVSDDSASSTTSDEECDIWNSWTMIISDWLRQRVVSAQHEKMRKSGMAVPHDCDRDDGSFTTTTTASDSSAASSESSGTNYMGTSVPQLVLHILRDELIEACGNVESVNETNETALKSYKISKNQQHEKLGLTFATNHKDGAIYICEIKQRSKFLHTGLQVGSRVVSINGIPAPKKPKKLLKMLKRARRELVLIAETPDPKVKAFLQGVCRDDDDFSIQTEPW